MLADSIEGKQFNWRQIVLGWSFSKGREEVHSGLWKYKNIKKKKKQKNPNYTRKHQTTEMC